MLFGQLLNIHRIFKRLAKALIRLCVWKSHVAAHMYLQAEVKNTVDPDQLASQKPVDIDLRYFLSRIYPGAAW